MASTTDPPETSMEHRTMRNATIRSWRKKSGIDRSLVKRISAVDQRLMHVEERNCVVLIDWKEVHQREMKPQTIFGNTCRWDMYTITRSNQRRCVGIIGWVPWMAFYFEHPGHLFFQRMSLTLSFFDRCVLIHRFDGRPHLQKTMGVKVMGISSRWPVH